MSNQVGDCFKFLWTFQNVQTLKLIVIGQNSYANLDSVSTLIVVTYWIWQESETKLCQRHNGCNA